MPKTVTVSITGMRIFEELARAFQDSQQQIAAVRAVCEQASGEGNHIGGVSVVKVPRVLAALSQSGQPTKGEPA